MGTDFAEITEFFDLTYSSEPASYYYLLIAVNQHHVDAAWYHSTKNLVTGFASYPLSGDIHALLAKHPFLGSSFKEVIICAMSNNYLVYPKNLIDGANHDVFSLTNPLDATTDTLMQTDLVNMSAGIAFAVNSKVITQLYESFGHLKIISHVAPRIEHELNVLKSRINKESLLVAHLSSDQIDIRIYKEDKLHLANCFYISSKEDIAYYVLYSAEMYGIKPENDVLELSGEIELGDEVWFLLSQYWKRMRVAAPLSQVEISQKLGNYPKATFDHLTQALLCVS